jgi:hypothetical protein
MDLADLFMASTISNQPVAGSIIVSARRDCVLAGVLIVNGVAPSDPHRPLARDTISDYAILGGSRPYFLSKTPSLSFDIIDITDEWNINNPCSTSCVRPDYVMVFLTVFSVLVYPR